jgi:hypothetical protein
VTARPGNRERHADRAPTPSGPEDAALEAPAKEAPGGPGSTRRRTGCLFLAAAVVIVLVATGAVATLLGVFPSLPWVGAPASSEPQEPDGTGGGPAVRADFTIDLPVDPAITHLEVAGGDAWFAQDDGELRGVYVGRLEVESAAPTLEDATEHVRDQLQAIPGAKAASEPVAIELPAGPARRFEILVGSSRFVALVLVSGGDPWRLVIVNYPDAVIASVAASFRRR